MNNYFDAVFLKAGNILFIIDVSISWMYFTIVGHFVNSLFISINHANLIDIIYIFIYLALILPIILVILNRLKGVLMQ